MRTLALFPLLVASQLPATPGMPAMPPTDEVTRTATIAGVVGALIVLAREFITWRRQLQDSPPRDGWRNRPDSAPLRLEVAGSIDREPSKLDDHRTD